MRPIAALLLLLLPLFATPARSDDEKPVPPLLPAGFSAEQLTLAAGSPPLHVIQGGRRDAPWLLLVHGLGQGAADWYPVLPQLAQHYRVIAFDLPGFGQSPPPREEVSLQYYAALMHGLVSLHAKDRIRVAGHSLGAAVALRHAHDYPQDVERLLLLDAAGILHPSVYLRHMSRVRTERSTVPLLNGLLKAGERLANGVSGSIQDRLAVSGPSVATKASRFGGQRPSLAASLALGRENFNTLLPAIEVPVWILWGADDPVAPPRTGRALQRLLSHSSLETLPGVGHVPQSVAPAATVAWMLRALEQPMPERKSAALQQHGSASCSGRKEAVFFSDGSWDLLTLDRCRKVSISNARIGRLQVNNSTVELNNVTIDGADVAIAADSSNIEATGLHLRAKTAFKVQGSRIDLAAAQLDSADIGTVDRHSRVFLSLSQWCDGNERRGLHGVWEPRRQTLEQAIPKAVWERCVLPAD